MMKARTGNTLRPIHRDEAAMDWAPGPWWLLKGLLLFAMLSITCDSHGQTKPALAALGENGTVLFQGDSITDGGRWREGTDFNHIMGQDYAYIVAAEVGALYPERNITLINRGIGGDTVPKMAVRWKTDALDLKPDLLSILIGINDTLTTQPVETTEEYEMVFDKLLAETIAALPSVKIVLGEPFLLPVGNYKSKYADKMADLKKRQDAVARLTAKYHLPLIRYQKLMTDACAKAPAEYWSWDGVHPTYAGHGLMAKEWMRVVGEAWPKP